MDCLLRAQLNVSDQKHCEPLVAVWLRPSTTEPCICCKQVAEKPRGEHLKNDVCMYVSDLAPVPTGIQQGSVGTDPFHVNYSRTIYHFLLSQARRIHFMYPDSPSIYNTKDASCRTVWDS